MTLPPGLADSLLQGRAQGFIRLVRKYESQDGLWTWPETYFAHREVITNDVRVAKAARDMEIGAPTERRRGLRRVQSLRSAAADRRSGDRRVGG
jgi:hypothetical protein